MSTEMNNAFFAPYHYRKRPKQRPIRFPSRDRLPPIDSNSSIFPELRTKKSSQENQKISCRNDFANNGLFLTKTRLAKFFLSGSTPSRRSTDELVFLFDRQKNHKTPSKNVRPKFVVVFLEKTEFHSTHQMTVYFRTIENSQENDERQFLK